MPPSAEGRRVHLPEPQVQGAKFRSLKLMVKNMVAATAAEEGVQEGVPVEQRLEGRLEGRPEGVEEAEEEVEPWPGQLELQAVEPEGLDRAGPC